MRKTAASLLVMSTIMLYGGCGGNKKPVITPQETKPAVIETQQEQKPLEEPKLEEKISTIRPIYTDKISDLREYFNAKEAYENFITAYEEGDKGSAEKYKQELLDNLKFLMQVLDVKNIDMLYKNKENISSLISGGLNSTPEKNFNLNLTDEDIDYINNMDPEDQKKISGVLKNIIETKKSDSLDTKVLYDFQSNPGDPRVQNYIKLFVGEGKLAEWYAEALQRGQKYFPFIEQEAEKRGLPKKIKYLYLVESAFTEVIRSRAGAQGFSQFMAETARKYGLVVNNFIDERRNPMKAIPASMDYILDLIHHFEGNIELAISAYNVGENGLDRRMEGSGTLTLEEAVKSRALPRETRNFLPQIDASYIIGENFEDFEIPIKPYEGEYPPVDIDTIIVNEPTSLKVIASCAGTSLAKIRELNPWLPAWRTPKNYENLEVYLPEGTADAYLENIVNVNDKTPASTRFYAGIRIENDQYVVGRGDTGLRIAAKLKVKWYHLEKANPGIKWNRLIPNKTRLNVPEYSPFIKE